MMAWFIAMCILPNHPGNIGSGIRITRQFGTCSKQRVQMGFERFLSPNQFHQSFYVLRNKPCPLPCISLYVITGTLHGCRIKRSNPTAITQTSPHQFSFRIKIIPIVPGKLHIFIIKVFTVMLLRHLGYQPVIIGKFQSL